MRGTNWNTKIVAEHIAVPQIEIISEHERPGHWRFEIQVLDNDGTLRQHVLTLSWADYNLWSSDGGDEPSRVADAVVNFLLSREGPAALPAKFDASLARRKHRDADQIIPTLIGR